jgi:hypothetical protein
VCVHAVCCGPHTAATLPLLRCATASWESSAGSPITARVLLALPAAAPPPPRHCLPFVQSSFVANRLGAGPPPSVLFVGPGGGGGGPAPPEARSRRPRFEAARGRFGSAVVLRRTTSSWENRFWLCKYAQLLPRALALTSHQLRDSLGDHPRDTNQLGDHPRGRTCTSQEQRPLQSELKRRQCCFVNLSRRTSSLSQKSTIRIVNMFKQALKVSRAPIVSTFTLTRSPFKRRLRVIFTGCWCRGARWCGRQHCLLQ